VLLASVSRRLLVLSALGLWRPTLAVAGLTALTFGLAEVALPDAPAAAAGFVLYALVLLAIRPRALGAAWAHVRALR